ncbi:MAG: molybdopterin-binding protein [Kiritimatiellae bacterium]|nr:molybdopterin-binding protein [Kiritimatiellia bacterium]
MELVSVNVSAEKGTVKHPVHKARIDEYGVVGDAHAGAWHRQVSMISEEMTGAFAIEAGRNIAPGAFGENLTVRGMDLRQVGILDRFLVGKVNLEVTQIGKECHGATCAIYREIGKCIMPHAGVFCRVLAGGEVKPGDNIEFVARPLRILVITLSDRASRGDYADKSGPAVKAGLMDFFAGKCWHAQIETIILPDDATLLRQALARGREEDVDIVFTTGGTGVGPRDIAPDVVISMADKIIPGIMEWIRLRFGRDNPNALLSRSVAAILGRSIVYTLPGSPKAVTEYMDEILKTMEHMVFMIHGVDRH